MNPALHLVSTVSRPIKWSVYAGLYMFACGVATAFLLSDLLTLLADVIGLPTPYSMVILASPALVIGAGAWWAIVERRDSYTYLRGGVAGLVTALFTGVLWTGRFVSFWGFEMLAIPIISVLVVLVLGLAGTAGVLAGVPLTYARRRLDSEPSGGPEGPI